MLNHRFTVTSPLTSGPTSGTAAFNAALDSWEVLGWVYSMFLQCAYQIVASGDGDLLVDTTGVPVFTTMAYNNSDGHPVTPKQAGPNTPNIAGSTNNYACWFTVTNPVDTPDTDRCWWTFSFGFAQGTIGNSGSFLCLNIYWHDREPDFTACTPTRCPTGSIIEEEKDEILMSGAPDVGFTVADIYERPTKNASYPLAYFTTLTYWNFGFDSDPARSTWWLSYWPQGGVSGKAGETLIASDLVVDPPYGDRSRCVAVQVHDTTYGIATVGLSTALRAFGRYDVPVGTGVVATSYGGGDGNTASYPATYCAAGSREVASGDVVPSFVTPTTTGRGTNSLGNGEQPMPIRWQTPDNMDQSRCGGYKGTSSMFMFCTNGSESQLQKRTIGAKDYVLLGQVWVEINDGASPGLNGVAFTL